MTRRDAGKSKDRICYEGGEPGVDARDVERIHRALARRDRERAALTASSAPTAD